VFQCIMSFHSRPFHLYCLVLWTLSLHIMGENTTSPLGCPEHSSATNQSECVCFAGYTTASAGGACAICPTGRYCPTTQDILMCPPGTFQSGLGQTSVLACTSCLAGTYGSYTGQSECTQCHAGTVQTGRGVLVSSRCMACTAGTYQTGRGVGTIAGCIRCLEGTYQTGFGMGLLSDCKSCQAGTFQPHLGQTFASACLPCQKGRYQTGVGVTDASRCAECPAGTFQTGLAAGLRENCTLCQPGAFLDWAGAVHPQNCTLCPIGTFQTGLGATNVSHCGPCSAGTFETGVGNSQAMCTRCRAGTYQTGRGLSSTGACVECGPGTYQTGLGSTSSSQCLFCGAGTFLSASGGNRVGSCQACGAGTFQTGMGATAARNCTPCAPGGYQTGTGAASQGACILCSMGTYQSVAGATSGSDCLLCGAGVYQSRLGGDTILSCVSCSRGTYQTGVGMTAPLDCIQCPMGRFQTSLAATSEEWCALCGAGTYGPLQAAGDADNCTRCGPGNYHTGLGASSAQVCTRCDQGKVQPSSSARTSSSDCIACGPGTYASSLETGTCQACAAGTFQTGHMQSNCNQCRRGTYLPFPGVRYESWCAPCERGTYQSITGASSPTACVKCMKGTFTSAVNGVSACTACVVGTYSSAAGGELCHTCPIGTYTSRVGADSCDTCLSGTYGNSTGLTGCLQCRRGHFQLGNGTSACSLCPPGKFQTGGGETVCSQCEQGMYHQLSGQVTSAACTNCSAGSYGSDTGISYCTACPPGVYSDDSGWTGCSACGPGAYQNASSQTRCRSCSPGSYSTGLGMISEDQCWACPSGYYSSALGSTACHACYPGTFQTGTGAYQCGECAAGTFMAFAAWQEDPCMPCVAGTYSTSIGASSGETCALCDDGLFSQRAGRNSSQVCRPCPLGTVSTPNKTVCGACSAGTYCPPGYHLPIQCFPGLICLDGASVEAPPGHLAILRGNCTGIIPCPPGTNCTISSNKGLLAPYPNRTHFIVYVGGGDNQADLSCPGATLQYGYGRVDWPYNVSAYDASSLEILFWLTPLGCPSGAYLQSLACVPCPVGTNSSSDGQTSIGTCQPCPTGMHGPRTGSTACVACQAGEFSNTSGVSVCLDCPTGSYQGGYGSIECQLCPPGEFSGFFGSSSCTVCPSGTGQPSVGASFCAACDSTQYSSAGDVQCSSCGPDIRLDPRHTCPTPRLPQNTSAFWISVRGGHGSDDCVGINRSALSDNSTVLSTGIITLNPRGQCDHVLHVMDRPDLSRSWVYQRTLLRRPAVLRVISHNETFYPALCARQGFGVVFVLEDDTGSMYTDLSTAKATITVLDQTGLNQLFSMGCTRLPSGLADLVPVGTCYTSYCPATRVMVRVTVAWTGGSVNGSTLISSGPSVWCGTVSTWTGIVELVNPRVPYFPGELVTVYIRVFNSPAQLAVFRFVLKMFPGVALVSFRSVYSTVHQVERDTISVVGDSSQGTGTILGTLTLQIQSTMGAGVNMAVQMVAFQITLPNTVPYSMTVHTRGFSCRSDGYLQVLTDTHRTTALISNARRKTLVHWRKIQTWSGLSVTTGIDTIAVRNTMRDYGLVTGQCTSLHPEDLVVSSCAGIRAAGSGYGNQGAGVRVQYQSASTVVTLTVYVPRDQVLWTAYHTGISGRFKVFTSLQAGSALIQDVDATPYVAPDIRFSGPITVQNEQWTCMPLSDAGFSIGDPVLFTGLCSGGLQALRWPQPAFFLFTGGSPGLGRFTFSSSELTSNTSTGGLLLLSGPHWLPVTSSVAVSSSNDRVSLTMMHSVNPWLGLIRSGRSARCVPLTFDSTRVFMLPVYPPAPVSLRISLSATTLVSTNETFTGLLPLSTSVVEALLVFSDGTTLDVRTDPRFHMASIGPAFLNIIGLVAASGAQAGNTTLLFSVTGIPCATTGVMIRVMAYSVESSVLMCPLCPSVLTTPDDPLGTQYPLVYPSSVAQNSFFVRRVLADGTILRRHESLAVSGNGSLVNGRVLAQGQGYVVITTNHSDEPLILPIVRRVAVAWSLVCNGWYACDNGMKLAPPGDEAGLAPFSYSTSLALSLSLTLFNGSTANYSWLAGVTAILNQTELTGVGARQVPLLYGVLDIRVFFDERWQLATNTRTLTPRVERLAAVMVSGPTTLFQLHCSLMWEEGTYTTQGVLTDGLSRTIPFPYYEAVSPIVIHDPQRGLAHADWAGTGQIKAVFGSVSGSLLVQATLSNKYFTGVDIDFLPSEWSTALDQPLAIRAVLEPLFWISQWFTASNLTSRVLQWGVSVPDIIRVTPGSLSLLSDHYQPITVIAGFVACAGGSTLFTASKEVTVNVLPSMPGQIDIGLSAGIPVPPVPTGQTMSIPVYMYAPARLRSYTIEVYLDELLFESGGCTGGYLPNSQCAIMTTGPDAPTFFRMVGAVLQSQSTGRLLVGTVTGRPLLDAVGGVHVRVLQAIVGEQVLGSSDYAFQIRLGTSAGNYQYRPVLTTPMTGAPVYLSEAYGDTDGDGFFTSLDVLFMEHYAAVSVFAGEQQICTVQGRCQLKSQLTAWQLMQLKPVRNPNMPATSPDGSDLLFLLRALVGKTYFLASLEVRSHPGALSVSLSLRDHLQQINPPHAIVQIQLGTSANRYLAFDTPFEYNTQDSTLTVDCRREGQSLTISSLSTAVTVDESLVTMRVITQALDRFGSQESASNQERRFVFMSGGPLASFNVLGLIDSLLPETSWADYIPTTICQILCEDASLFLDNTVGQPEWLNETTLTAPFAMHPPEFRGFWPVIRLDSTRPRPSGYSVSIPANIPGPEAVLVGTSFNTTFQAPAGVIMGVFRVENTYATLLRAYDGADSVGNVFFMHTGRSNVAHLQLRLDRPGNGLPVRVLTLNAVPFELLAPNTLSHVASITGFAPIITSLRVEILCRSGVILWSTLGGVDEPCDVLLTPLWTPVAVGAGITVTCRSYPCILQGFSQTVRPVIPTYTPTRPRLLIQRGLIALGQRVQWRAVCDLTQQGNVTVTERALGAGVIRVFPANTLILTPNGIRGGKIGTAVIRFGNSIVNTSARVNVTDAVNPPRSITGFAFSGISVAVSGLMITATFQTGPLRPGERGYLSIKALYSGGYSILVDPRPGPDGISIVNASRDVIYSRLDGSFVLRKDAQIGPGRPVVTVSHQGVSTTIHADIVVALERSYAVTTVSVSATQVTATSPSSYQDADNNNNSSTPDVAITHIAPETLRVVLMGLDITGFYVHLRLDGPLMVQECHPGRGLPLFSDCVITLGHGIKLTGASYTPISNGSELALITFNGTYTGIWGFVEVHSGVAATRYPIMAGRYGSTFPIDPIAALMPALPIVDSTVLSRRYGEMMHRTTSTDNNNVSPHTRSPFYRAVLTLYLLTDRQRTVDARLYSNEFELSAMFRVMDRFLVPDANSSLVVTFHTDQLPSLPGSALIPGVGLQVPAVHALDGWYVVEWRQQIPVLENLAVSFTLETTALHLAWPWEIGDLLQTGLRLPSCPRAATDIGTFLVSYEITAPVEISQSLLDRIACSVQVTGRRVLLGPLDHSTGRRTLSIGVESLARVHQANLVIMSDWFTEQLGAPVQRKSLGYINDTKDPPIPCPLGFYFSQNGTYLRLPMHAVPGPDCYGMDCIKGYTLVLEIQQCIPNPVTMDMVWVCVLVVTTITLVLSGLFFCIQLSAYMTAPVEDIVIDTAITQAADGVREASQSEIDRQYQHIITGVVLDDCSVMMLDDDEFSPVPLDRDG